MPGMMPSSVSMPLVTAKRPGLAQHLGMICWLMSCGRDTRVTRIATATDKQQRRNLRHQAVADGEQRVGAARIGERHPVLRGADDDAAEQVDEHDQYAGDGVAAHEFAGAVHRAVEVRLLAHLLPAYDRIGLGDDAGVQIGVDGHLPAGHRVQGEPRAHFGDAPGALGDDDEVDDHQHREHHHADGVIAADHELPEGRDHVARGVSARVALDQHDARRGDVEPEPQQRRARAAPSESSRTRALAARRSRQAG